LTNPEDHQLRSILAPEEVLFKRKFAPTRYAEDDIYFANERDFADADRGDLPDSDLLKSVHAYTSAFYDAMARTRFPTGTIVTAKTNKKRPSRTTDERSMDETALVAFGILLEEAGREVLGHRGDLVFTEGDGVEAHDGVLGKRGHTAAATAAAQDGAGTEGVDVAHAATEEANEDGPAGADSLNDGVGEVFRGNEQQQQETTSKSPSRPSKRRRVAR